MKLNELKTISFNYIKLTIPLIRLVVFFIHISTKGLRGIMVSAYLLKNKTP